jgi:hypothetical protein
VQELPRPPWYRRVWMLNLAIAVVVVAALVAATVVVGSRRDERANPPMVTGAPATTASIQGGLSPMPPPTSTTLSRTTSSAKLGVRWEQSGSEGYYGAQFEVPNGWRLVWKFDCHSFAKYGGGNFKISGEGELDHISVQRFAVRESGSERVARGGRGRLVIETVCDSWTVKAVAP